MASSTVEIRPSFKRLYDDYVAAYNEHDIDKVLTFLSPHLTATYLGHVVASSAQEARDAYLSHWSRVTQPIVIHETVELEDGVRVMLDDDEGFRTTVRYRFVEHDGKWVHIRHDVERRAARLESD